MFDRWWEHLYDRVIARRSDAGRLRRRAGYFEALTSIVGNVLIFAVKFIVGSAIGSISMVADSFHTLADVLTSSIVLVGFAVSDRAPDREHPYGHGRGESIATLVIAILLILAGVELFMQSGRRLLHPTPVIGSLTVIALLLATGALKEMMASLSIWLGRRINSPVLLADAWHHRSDAITNILVGAAILGSMYGLHWLDGLLGIGVSFLIVHTGYKQGRTAANQLLGCSPADDLLAAIEEEAAAVNGVAGVHDVNVHDYGRHLAISLHIEVEGRMDVRRAHAIADEVERRVAERLNAEAVVHVDPREK